MTHPSRAPRFPTDLLDRVERVHLVGVGGSGMSSLATLLHDLGKVVTGSDLRDSAALRDLQRRGVSVFVGHDASHLGQAEAVIVTSAARPDNPELVEARRRGLPVLRHADALGLLSARKATVAVAGTHGKSTTTALTAYLLDRGGLDPTLIGGAEALNYGSASRVGRGPHLVVEADEFDRRFLTLHPTVAIVTGIEPDHLDYYRDLDELTAAFAAFVERTATDGLVVTCADDARLATLPVARRRETYGFSASAGWRAEDVVVVPEGTTFTLVTPESPRRRVTMRLHGEHHVQNALAAIVVARWAGVPLDAIVEALPGFRGTRRRLEWRGTARGVTILDDYAHHPTAVRLTLEAARRGYPGRLRVVFQSHTTHRTARFLDEFAEALTVADEVVLVPIYRPVGREGEAADVTHEDLARRIRERPTRVASSLEEAERLLLEDLRPGDVVVTMGAGDVDRVGDRLLSRLRGAP
ncbi:MAG TPA: UDP-N-acetylmuramate--L-alanine ligase [Chloroflexota bacterium]